MHLALAVEENAQQFDSLIEDNLAQYSDSDLRLKTDQKLAGIDLHAPLGYQNYLCWQNITL